MLISRCLVSKMDGTGLSDVLLESGLMTSGSQAGGTAGKELQLCTDLL